MKNKEGFNRNRIKAFLKHGKYTYESRIKEYEQDEQEIENNELDNPEQEGDLS